MPTRAIIVWAALGIALTGATQLRLGETPLGMGEVLVALWMLFFAFCMLRGARFVYTDAFRFLATYWGVSAVLLCSGTIMALRLGKFDMMTAQHDALAFVFVACLTCLLGIRLDDSQHDQYYLLLARATFFSITGSLGLLLGIALVTPQLGPIELWYAGQRFQGWAANPNQTALFVVAMPFLGWYLLKQARGFGRQFTYAVAIACCIAVGLATESDALRVAWAATLGSLSFWFWLRAAQRSRSSVMYVSHVAVPIILLTLVIALGGEIIDRVEQISESVYEHNNQGEQRIRNWLYGIEAISHSPLTGFGPGAYSGDYRAFDQVEAHNTLIDWGMSTGLLGVTLHIGVWLLCAWRALRSGTPELLGVVMCPAIDAVFGYSLRQPIYWLLLVLVLALTERRTFTLAPKTDEKHEPAQRQERRRPVPAFLAPRGSTSSS